jgi:nucleotide-binding universal stress UspA family protein
VSEIDLRTIVLAYDGSEGAEKAVALTRSLAAKYRAHVVVVVAFHHVSHMGSAIPTSNDIRDIHDSVTLAEALVAELTREGLSAESDVLEGPPADAIINVATTREADLIVMGSRGFGQFTGLLLGSVSDRVVHYSTVPVLVAR